MPVDDMNVLQPNYMADMLTNYGADTLGRNHGLGVSEFTTVAEPVTPAFAKKPETANPMVRNVYKAKAREFGKPMSQMNAGVEGKQ
jgi:hypothetical protein